LEAIIEYNAALRLKPDDAEAHNNLGNAYVKRNRFDEAVNEFMTALELKPDFAEAHNNLQFCYGMKTIKR
jgi:Flp pilus assembly protein TadD